MKYAHVHKVWCTRCLLCNWNGVLGSEQPVHRSDTITGYMYGMWDVEPVNGGQWPVDDWLAITIIGCHAPHRLSCVVCALSDWIIQLVRTDVCYRTLRTESHL